MGTYKLSYKEVKESFNEFLWNLEGDWDIKDIIKAYNSIAIKESWKERLTLKKNKQEKKGNEQKRI